MDKNKGFTIIELLVVVSIVSLLSTLALGTYTNAQRNARNTALNQQVTAYIKGLIAYSTDNGVYPFSSNRSSCLGSNYELSGILNAGECRKFVSGFANSEAADLVADLQPYVGTSAPLGTAVTTSASNLTQRGALYSYSTNLMADGEPAPHHIAYRLEGSAQTCVQLGDLLTGNWPNMTRTEIGYSGSSNGITSCLIALPSLD